MTIDPTREEWLEARDAFAQVIEHPGRPQDILKNMDRITEAALGPCPPEPAPKDLCAGDLFVTAVKVGDCLSVVVYCDDPGREDPCLFTPDEADAMAAALVEHAKYAREQTPTGDDAIKEPTRAPVAGPLMPGWRCGFVLTGPLGERVSVMDPDGGVCQRPKGHTHRCGPHRLPGDDDA